MCVQNRIRPREGDAQNFLVIWDTNGSPNPSQKTRLSDKKKKEKKEKKSEPAV